MLFRKNRRPRRAPRTSLSPDLGAAALESATVEPVIRAFIRQRSPLLADIDLRKDTALFTGGLLDSLSLIDLIQFIEQRFGVVLSAGVTMDRMDTLDQITHAVMRGAA